MTLSSRFLSSFLKFPLLLPQSLPLYICIYSLLSIYVYNTVNVRFIMASSTKCQWVSQALHCRQEYPSADMRWSISTKPSGIGKTVWVDNTEALCHYKYKYKRPGRVPLGKSKILFVGFAVVENAFNSCFCENAKQAFPCHLQVAGLHREKTTVPTSSLSDELRPWPDTEVLISTLIMHNA